MVQRTVCSGEEEEDEEESNTIESNSCKVEAHRHARCQEGLEESPEVSGRSANYSESIRRSRESSDVTKVIVVKPGRESSGDFTTNGNTTASGGRFSLFKWFKRGSRDSGSSWDRREREKGPNDRKSTRESSDLENEIESELSSTGSVETLYSTATVRSFAFKSGSGISNEEPSRHFGASRVSHFVENRTCSVGPFGVGAAKLNTKSDPDTRRSFDVTKTLPANVLSNRKRDITARYSLQSCNGSSTGFGSCTNFPTRGNEYTLNRGRNSDDPRKVIRVHVRGKRRAPGPPIDTQRNIQETTKSARINSRRKRRQAPKPPDATKLRLSENLADRDERASLEVVEKTAIALVIKESGSVISPTKEEARSEQTGSAIPLTEEQTGSAISSIKKETGSAVTLIKEETGSEISTTRKEPGSAISATTEHTGSAISSKTEKIESTISSTKEQTGSAISPTENEIDSAVASIGKNAESVNNASKESAGANSSVKNVCTIVPIRKQIGSESTLRERQNEKAYSQHEEIVDSERKEKKDNPHLPELKECENLISESARDKTEFGSATSPKFKRVTSAKEASFDETAIERSKKTGPEIGKDSAGGKNEPSIISLKNLQGGSCRSEQFEGSKAPAENPNDFATKCNDGVIEQSKNGNSTVPRNNEDATNLVGNVESCKTIGAKASLADLAGSISNDSLVLQGGVLHSRRETQYTTGATSSHASELKINVSRSKGRISVTTGSQTSASAMPRPWYKRSVFEHAPRDSTSSRHAGDVLRNPTQPEVRDERSTEPTNSPLFAVKHPHVEKNQDTGTLGRLSFFHKHDRTNDEKKKENKRKSGVSLLANISELDKEAAAIVQEEQARTRAASVLMQASKSSEEKFREETEEIVQEMVTSAMETSPKRGTRALISKFNAIGNITKVTVNTSFFAKSPQSRVDTKFESEITGGSIGDEKPEKSPKNDHIVRAEKDLSRYFLPIQKNTRIKKIEDSGTSLNEVSSRNSGNDLAARLSFFQSISSPEGNKRTDSGIRETSIEAKIGRLNEQISNERNSENSPKFSRLRINVVNENSAQSKSQKINEKTRQSRIVDGNAEGANSQPKNIEIVQKEFSNIFRELDKKIESTREFEKTTKKTTTTNQVSRVLDILVEAEKNDRQKANLSRSKINDPINENSEKGESKLKLASSSESTENSMKTDLREMLKEMKHSLPKRTKPKKPYEEEVLTKNKEDNSKCEVKQFVSINERKKEFFLSDNERSSLLSPATITHPPMIRIGPSRNDETSRSVLRPNEERDNDRQKVSSAAQTSGNLRKISDQNLNKSGKWRNEDVIYRTSGKGIVTPGTSGLTKNTFQLIRPREFAQIEAIKTMKSSNAEENTYANVIEQSLYANALVRPKQQNEPEVPRGREQRSDFSEAMKLRDQGRETIDMEVMDSKVVEPQNMNTLAVNRLLRKLEAAIASGHHQQAAGLAKELARLKIHCSVVRQRTKAKDVVNVNMYIEDKLAHQGPIPLRLTRSMTVGQLKTKVFTEFEIPIHVQRWIVGKDLADDDSTTLEDLQTMEGSSVFLYLVAPELKTDDAPLQEEKEVIAETPKNPELDQVNEILEVANVEDLTKPPVECQTINEEDDEECITEEVRMERYEALISLENCDVIPNSEPIECPICFVTYGPQEGVILRDCLHMFCRPCIANTIRYCEEAEVKCPFRDTEYTCESTLQEREIKALVEPEVYQQHLAKSIAQAENNAGNNAFHCKTPDCPGWCIYDDNVNNFLCPVCGVNNCLTCQVVHTGKNCRQYQEELRLSKETDQESKRTAAMLEEMVDRGEALPCPTCAVVLMKKWGCDWLRCSMCKTEICWVTRGPRWGPGGKGDTSGGCRCGEKGIKCHPRCNYCH